MLISDYQNDTHRKSIIDEYRNSELNPTKEMVTGIPKPQKYDHYLINKYSFPKGLV